MDALLTTVAPFTTLLTVGLSLIAVLVTLRKAPAEIAGVKAHAKNDQASSTKVLAEANNVWLSSYNEMVMSLLERDRQIRQLTKEIQDISRRIELSEAQHARDLMDETSKRLIAEKERDDLKKTVQVLEYKVMTLETEIAKLKSAKATEEQPK